MRDLLIVLLIAGSIPMIVMRPWIGILVWSWIAYMNPHKLGWGFTNTLPVAMLVGAVTLMMLVLTKDRKGVAWSREMIALILMAILFTASTLFAWVPEDAWGRWDTVMKIFLITFVTTMLIYGRERIWWLLLVIALSIGFYGFKGGIFSLLTGGQYLVWGPEGSFIGGNTEIGLALIMVIPLLYILARREERKWLKNALYATMVLAAVATVFTYSRGALLGLAIIAPFIFLRMRRKWLVAALVVPMVAVAAVKLVPEKLIDRAETIETYKEDNSAMQRIQAWGVAFNVAVDRPLGAGFRMENAPTPLWISYANFLGDWNNRSRAAHSIYFQILGEHGFIGLGLFLFVLLSTMWRLRRMSKAYRDDPDLGWVADYSWALYIGLIGYAVSGAFLSLAYFDLFYAFVALNAILQREVSAATVTQENTIMPRMGLGRAPARDPRART